MKYLLLPILILFFIPSVGYSADPEYTTDQKELAGVVGIILPGMSKAEVEKFLGEPKKTGTSASTGEEAWFYSAPEQQVIYFKGDEVDRVEYIEKKEMEEPPEVQEL